ncbi:serine O-acetyltransferase [Parafannyhessea sp. LCP21S3_E6]|uniref:serine O-acetyltransferase n=1 Tax=unclassified Parafannyhessea TaxID=2847323 RepID=UPI003F9657D9
MAERLAAMNVEYAAEKSFFGGTRRHFPSRSACVELISDIRRLLFPGYFDNESAAGESNDYLTRERILHIERVLQGQVLEALLFDDGDLSRDEAGKRASHVANVFLDSLPQVLELLMTDIQALYDGDPAAGSLEEVLVAYPGLYAIFVYRIAHVLYGLNVPLIPRLMSEHAHSKTGIDINPGANIGKYFFIDHGTGVVIGETTDIGDHVKIYQGVTLGALSTRKGQLLSGKKRHPTLGDYVTVYSNASILGGETVIGSGAVISGSAFVCESVPQNARVILNQETIVHKPDDAEPAWCYVI